MQPKGKPPLRPSPARTPAGQKGTKEDRIREMIERDPQRAAELLRQLFLKGK